MKRRLALVLLLIATANLGAAEVRIGILSPFLFPSLDSMVENTLNFVFDNYNEDEKLLAPALTREGEEALNVELAEKHKALLAENYSYKAPETKASAVEPNTATIVQLTRPEWFDDSKNAIIHLMKSNRLDYLFSLDATSTGNLLSYTLSVNTLEDQAFLCDRLFMLQKTEEEFLPISKAIMDYLELEYSYIHLISDNNTYSIKVDGAPEPLLSNYVIVPSGEHELLLSAYAKAPYFVAVSTELKEVTELSFSLVDAVYPPLYIKAIPQNGLISIQGAEPELDFVYKNSQRLPFMVNVSAPGFADSNHQVNQSNSLLTLELKPEWMLSDKRLEDAKKDSYSALRNAIVMFGFSVLSRSLANVYQASYQNIALGVNLTFDSLAIISLLDFIYKSGKYFQVAKETYY